MILVQQFFGGMTAVEHAHSLPLFNPFT